MSKSHFPPRRDTNVSPEAAAIVAAAALVAAAVAVPLIAAWRRRRAKRQKGAASQQEAQVRPGGPRPGDILLFYRPARRRDYIIRLVTRSPFYHAALWDDGDEGEGSQEFVVEARPEGVRRNSLQGRERNFVIVGAPDNKGEAALNWAKTQIGSGYDRKDMLVILLDHLFVRWHINYAPPGRYTCAEFVTAAYQHAGVTLVPGEEPSGVDPGDIGARWLPDQIVKRLG